METSANFELTTSKGFSGWLAQCNSGLVFTTYQGGKVFFLGVQSNGKLSIYERNFPKCMGLAVNQDARTIFVATHHAIYRLDDYARGAPQPSGHDAVYCPTQAWFTGDVDAHEVAVTDDEVIFANTSFNCVASLRSGCSFRPIWSPRFVSDLSGEDKCHLNGVCVSNGRLSYVTCFSRSDVKAGWRRELCDGGVVVDTRHDEVVLAGLSMPHSPRDYAGRLWVLNSGSGDFGFVDFASGKFEKVAFCCGFARGLGMLGRYAVIGLSKPRSDGVFGHSKLDDRLVSYGRSAMCGLIVVDIISGDVVEWMRIEGPIYELFDVAFLPGVICPSAIGPTGPDVERTIFVSWE